MKSPVRVRFAGRAVGPAPVVSVPVKCLAFTCDDGDLMTVFMHHVVWVRYVPPEPDNPTRPRLALRVATGEVFQLSGQQAADVWCSLQEELEQ